ncbi:MAG: hypothetical protein KKG00_16380, partial [Bacteroidetes bacterium]|nr:hypothetical protein [Bacteroidota bacterium]
MKFITPLGYALLLISLLASCNKNSETVPATEIVLKDYSVTPSFVKALPGFESLEITTLIS